MKEVLSKDISQLEKRIGVKFKNKDLLIQSLIHCSYLNEHPNFYLSHNERLEFLGDAVLEIIVTKYLYENYSNPEGELTNWRASLVNAKTLSDLALTISLNDYIFLSKGESKDPESKARQYILANAMEALIGAIYLDRGMRVAENFVKKNLLIKLPFILKHKLYLDPKTKFQELAQELLAITPNYKVIKEWGLPHAKHFRIGIYLESELVASGEGMSKQEAETKAAEKALKKKNW